jgi:thioredoxin reductase (NADPH)
VPEETKLAIIGSGAAAYTAAIYGARANLGPVVYGGTILGGQLLVTSDVENFPGFPEPILGPELMERMKKQVERLGVKIHQENVMDVDFSKRPFRLKLESGGALAARAVIVATGATAKWLDLESEKKLQGHGVSACATCDGFFFKGKEVVVVGGGDTAMEEALFLTKFASRVTVVHRRAELRASKIMQGRALKNPKVQFVWDSAVIDVLGDGSVSGVRLKNLKTGAQSDLPCQGLFVAIGHAPNTGFLRGQLKLDAKGYVETDGRTRTSVEGVFAAGDVMDPRYRQAVTAAGTGCMAAIEAERFLQAEE